MNKSSRLYLTIVFVWLMAFGAVVFTSYAQLRAVMLSNALAGALIMLTLLFIGYFWLNGVKDTLYTAWYYLVVKKRRVVDPIFSRTNNPHVVLVYCTRNDFNADALARSMNQDYVNVRTVILDDSDQLTYREEIDAFAKAHDVTVVRRSDRTGFKAGNLNNYLRDASYDYFVLLDSDEVIPPEYIRRSLAYFANGQRTGIVQANHIATRNVTLFQQKFARGVNSHWPVYQTVKDGYGFLSLLGHGAMVSKACYDAAGDFPLVVAEDICFSLAAREAGYLTVFAPDITCEEEYPVDYFAFRKRHNKWTQGNMEFIRRNTWPIMTSRQLTWYEKLDIVLFTYSLPLTAVFSLFIVVNVVVLPLMQASFQYPLWMLVPTVLFLLAPMANDVVYHWKKTSKRELFSYSVGSMLLYGSMYYTSLRASLKSMFGGSVFHVTPKTASRITWLEALRLAKGELLFAFVAMVVTLVCTHSLLATILITIPAMTAAYLMVRHQPTKKERTKQKALDAAR